MKKKKFLNYSFSFTISLIMILHSGPLINQRAQAFFEDQIKYKIAHHWYPMLKNSSPEKKSEALRAFLAYPEWSLPLLRNAVMNLDSENLSWEIAMLIGMLGDSSDVPPLLKIWKEKVNNEYSTIWLGAMRRLYWKSRSLSQINLEMRSLTINFTKNSDEPEIEEKEVNLQFEIKNPAHSPIFIRVAANFWLTKTDENITPKYLWIPAGGRVESSMKAIIYPAFNADKIRLDFRIWEIGVSEPILHHSRKISFPFE